MTDPSKRIPLQQIPAADHGKAALEKMAAAPMRSEPVAGAFVSHNRREVTVGLSAEQLELESRIVGKLREVYDPELPINIYDLGLIYDIAIAADHSVEVRMTLTAPGCPVAGSLPGEVQRKIEELAEVSRVAVELVWDPQWGREMMSEAALLELGLL